MDDGTAAGQTLERQLSRSWNRNGEAQMRRELQIISCFGQVQCQIGRLPWTCLVDGTFPRGRDILSWTGQFLALNSSSCGPGPL
jgi:hypothetical protein